MYEIYFLLDSRMHKRLQVDRISNKNRPHSVILVAILVVHTKYIRSQFIHSDKLDSGDPTV